MKLAVIGLGDIAQKAYLPVYAERSDIEVYLISRDAEKAKRLQAAYRFAGTYATFADAVQEGIDAVMIHSATIVHAEQARQALEAGIAVYVDKPVSMEIEEIRELTRLSEEKQLPFITGFNRRFASAHQRLLEVTIRISSSCKRIGRRSSKTLSRFCSTTSFMSRIRFVS